MGFVGIFYVQMGTFWVHNLTLKHKNVSHGVYLIDGILHLEYQAHRIHPQFSLNILILKYIMRLIYTEHFSMNYL